LQTPLYDEHQKLGGRMVDFAGWALPLQYTSITKEHMAVREAAGLFDVSHMGEFFVRGPQALAFLRWVTLNDPAKLKVGRAQYSMLPNDRGGVVDDVYVYRTGEEEYLVVVNAANVVKDWAHLNRLAGGYAAELEDASEDWALMALQGPEAEGVLQTLTETDLSQVRKNATLTLTVAGVPARRVGWVSHRGKPLPAPDQQGRARCPGSDRLYLIEGYGGDPRMVITYNASSSGLTELRRAQIPSGGKYGGGGIVVNTSTNNVFVTNSLSNNVAVLGGDGRRKAIVPVGNDPFGVGVDPVTNQVYVGNRGSNNIYVLHDVY